MQSVTTIALLVDWIYGTSSVDFVADKVQLLPLNVQSTEQLANNPKDSLMKQQLFFSVANEDEMRSLLLMCYDLSNNSRHRDIFNRAVELVKSYASKNFQERLEDALLDNKIEEFLRHDSDGVLKKMF